MQYLSFTLGEDYFVIPTQDIVTVLPMLQLTEVPQTPGYVAGIFRYREQVHLVVDLAALTQNRPSEALVSTRIVLVKCLLNDGAEIVIGLLLESAINTLQLDEEGWQLNPIKPSPGQIVGMVHSTAEYPYQRVKPNELLNETVLSILHANQ